MRDGNSLTLAQPLNACALISTTDGYTTMVNRHIDIMQVGSRANRAIGFDMISRRCAEAYEVYFSGNMLRQGSRCDSLGAVQDSELCVYGCRKNGGDGRQRFAAMPEPAANEQQPAPLVTYVSQLSILEQEFSSFRAHMARTEWLASLGVRGAGLAHEMTQPLTVIRLSLDDVLDKLGEVSSRLQSAKEALREALAQVPNLASMTERFRNLARDPSDRDIANVDARKVAERIAKLFNGNVQRIKIRLRLGEKDRLPLVSINERDLEQLFFALVENAIHAANGRDNRNLIIDASVKEPYLELCFSDNCGGIPPENIERIFQPFFSTKPPSQGTGLGLCVVQQIVSRIGGGVRVESEFGRGATFFVDLPLSRAGTECRNMAAS